MMCIFVCVVVVWSLSICIHSPIFRINSSSYYVTSGYELGLVWMKGHKHIHTSYVTSYMTIFRKKNLHFPPSYILIKKLWMRLHSFICNHASFNMTMNLQFIEKARQKRLHISGVALPPVKSLTVNTILHYSLPSKYFKGLMSYAQVGFFILCLNEWYSISALVHKVTYSRLCIGFWKKLLFVCNLMIVLGFGLSEIATCLTIPRVWYYNH